MDLGEFRTAVGPLKHTLKGWPTHPASPQAWRALVQAALGANQKEAASGALSRWLETLSGRPDAAVDLGTGGAAPASETEAALRVCLATVQLLHRLEHAFSSLSYRCLHERPWNQAHTQPINSCSCVLSAAVDACRSGQLRTAMIHLRGRC